ncbi:malectin domain-containing carbohydrate-binding protein [Rubellicoccus peritrichatus]|uniref:Malectin domain-containing carbohydrate-binding protein n=1 Tax=Rubellicoccus peritrichatus TaxID=3080537 RepID=A0AAQ3L9C4_9BACT|nr:malectin domain-containing carbohydrate-binding protein [Puniceicoccus sp. CR14]WOO40329.1 malectin domain-containing carbohydrate-binding protein [Puniceicoccus sp. CR14]
MMTASRYFSLFFSSFVFLGSLGLSVLDGKPVEAFEDRSFTLDGYGDVMPYRLYVPEHYDPARSYPLIINLHGLGGSGGNDKHMIDHAGGAMYFADDSFQAREPSFVLIPQEPSSTSKHWHQSPVRYIFEGLLDAIEEEFSIDEDRIYLGGTSMGGHGAWKSVFFMPNRFAALFPTAGWSSSGNAPGIKHVPIWDFHASDDSVVNVRGSRNMVEAVRNAGGSVVYTEYTSGGHVLGVAANRQVELQNWLMAQRRGRPATGIPLLDIQSVIKGDTLTLSGIANNGAPGVERVEWQNNRGGSGTALGTDEWAISGIVLQEGVNVIRVTGYGPAPVSSGLPGETSFNQVIEIDYVPTVDVSPPTLQVDVPVLVSGRFETTASSIVIGGVAADNESVASVAWSSVPAGSGDASGLEVWSANVPLEEGENVITVTVEDTAGNCAQQILRVMRVSTVNAPPNVLAGPDATIIAPEHSLLMESYVGDDGLPNAATLLWTQVSGPPGVVFDDPAAIRPVARFPKVGDYVLELTACDGEYCVSDQVVVSVRPQAVPDPDDVVVAINVNGPRYTGSDGVAYMEGDDSLFEDPDYSFAGSNYDEPDSVIVGTPDPTLYQTAYWSRSSFEFRVPLPNGDYVVTLKMLDFTNNAGVNIRDIFIGGNRVLEKYDVLEHVPKLTAHDLDIPVTVSDGELFLYHEDFGYRSLLAAIVVRDALPPAANTGPTVDAGEGLTVPLNASGRPAPSVDDDGALPGWLFPELRWSQVSGPGTAYFSDESALSPHVTFSEAGTYVLSLVADDGEFEFSDTVSVDAVASASPQVRFDFGSGSTPEFGWNVVSGHSNAVHVDAVDENGESTGIGLAVTAGFLNKDKTGKTESVLYNADAVKDGFYTNLHRVAEVTLSGLDPDKLYDITIYASTTSDIDAEGVYTVGGVVRTLQAYDNTTETVTLPDLAPDTGGNIVLSARASDATGRVVISVLAVSEKFVPTVPPGFSAWIRSLYPDVESDDPMIAMDSDPQGRGLTNFEAYALAAPPGATKASVGPVIGFANDMVGLTFNIRTESDLAYRVMASENLIDWIEIAVLDPADGAWGGAAVVEEGGAGSDVITVQDDNPLTDGSGRFLMLEALPRF